jgi:hypothetical protein
VTTAATHLDPDPATVADVHPAGIYRLAVLARLLGVTTATVLASYKPATLPRPGRTSPHRVYGHEILRVCGWREVQRCGRTAERGETQAERERRAAADVAELNRILAEKGKPQGRSAK